MTNAAKTASAASDANEADVATVQRKGLEAATAQRNTTHGHKKWVWRIAGAIAFLLILKGTMLIVPPLWKAWRAEVAQENAAEATRAAAERQRSRAETPTVADSPVVGQTFTIMVNDREWTRPLRVTHELCVRWWDDDPDGDAVTVSARGVNDATWYEWKEFLRLKAMGKIPYENIGWIRFKAKSGEMKVYYQFGRRGTCT